MLRFDQANELVNLLADRFDGLIKAERDREAWRDWISRLDQNDKIVTSAIERVVTDWTQRRNPTKPEITKFVERARIEWKESGRSRAAHEEARVLRDTHGDEYLAMFSRPSDYGCIDCCSDYIPRGIDQDNQFLRHEHFTDEEVDKNPALEIAIAAAKSSSPHPLESAAQPRSKEAWSKMIGTWKETVGKIARVNP